MSTLTALKMISAKRITTQNPVVQRRNKLGTKLFEQIELAKALIEGRTYAPTKFKTISNVETGETRSIEVQKRVKQWWWTSETGKLNLSIRYGAKVLELAKGKNAIEVAGNDELVATLTLIKKAVEAGELDAQIDVASNKLRSGFTK